ncbi:hypothetical protein LTR36_004338 [Oleoguttula mirabilis]|uniref:Uncharacterized protein n=1 Tax=Oleoguttula mirabilis TaxID=1507867 RepID=A0AAV9JH86_9PEZI|nr:hypothetical protein LTR36_004338 [Oleoguttula mirabilis]
MLVTRSPIRAISICCTQVGDRFGTVKVVAADGIGVTLGELLTTAGEFYAFCGHAPRFCRFVELKVLQPIGD